MTSTHTTIVQKLVAAEQSIADFANKSWYDECEEAVEGNIMTVSKPLYLVLFLFDFFLLLNGI